MKTEIVKIDINKLDENLILKAVTAIDGGELVGIPTETVYGIACRTTLDSIQKLNALKNRTPEKHYTLHIGKKENADNFVPRIDLRTKKLIQNCWPGPLTIIFELSGEEIKKQKEHFGPEIFEILYKNNSIGIRCPENHAASTLLQKAVYPVVVPSANTTGAPPATTAQEVLKYFDGQIRMVLDGGKCKYNQSSTVATTGQEGFKVLRAGVLSEKTLNESSIVKFLFVCSGNSCRSPMAEGIFSKLLAEKLHCNIDQLEEKGYKILSAGTMGLIGLSASAEAIAACAELGIDISKHVSSGLTAKLVDECDYIFVMGQNHYQQIVEIRPEAAQKCFLLGDEEISDPIGQSQEVYKYCSKKIYNAIQKRIGELLI